MPPSANEGLADQVAIGRARRGRERVRKLDVVVVRGHGARILGAKVRLSSGALKNLQGPIHLRGWRAGTPCPVSHSYTFSVAAVSIQPLPWIYSAVTWLPLKICTCE